MNGGIEQPGCSTAFQHNQSLLKNLRAFSKRYISNIVIHFQAREAAITTERPYTLLSLSIRRLVFGVSNAKNGKTGQLDCVETLANKRSWDGKRQMS